MNEPEQDVRWLVEDLLPTSGLGLLAAKPKVGKSTLARNLAVAVARGEPFLGRTCSQGPVIYLALEEKRAEVRRHFGQMNARKEPLHIHTGAPPSANNADNVAALALLIAKTGAVLAIADPLLYLVRLRDANDYAEVSATLAPFNDLARGTGCHLLFVHHAGKVEREGSEAVLGSTAIHASVDTTLLMKRDTDGRTLSSEQRYGPDLPATVLTLDPETGWSVVRGEVAALKLAEQGAAILAALGDEALDTKAIMEAAQMAKSTVLRALRDLMNKGHVGLSGRGSKNDPKLYRALGPTEDSVFRFPLLERETENGIPEPDEWEEL